MADVEVKDGTENNNNSVGSQKKSTQKFSVIDNIDEVQYIKGVGKTGYPFGMIVIKFENGGEFSSFLRGNDLLVVDSLTKTN